MIPTTLPGLLQRNRDRYGAKSALVTEDRSMTHAELDDESRAVAGHLAANGVEAGTRVGVLLPNGIEWAVVACAAWRLGAVVVPLSTLLQQPELDAHLRIASITHLVLVKEFRNRSLLDDVEAVRHGLPALQYVALGDDLLHPPATEAPTVAVEPDDDFVVLFTSGSRATPKGTIHTHGSALHAVASGLAARTVGADDRLYIPMPFFWTGGLAAGLLTALVAGATLITEAVPEPARTLELLERERVTLFRGWPDQAARLAAHPNFATTDLSNLRPGSLAALLPADQRPAPGARANVFGMTETFGPYCGARLDLDMPVAKHGSCGQPFDGIEVRITDEAGGQCAPGATGEIRVRGTNLMRAICGQDPAATFDADGFYATSDLGALDADGYLWYHGRADDMFKVKGATVFPAEVEAALRTIPGVRQAHVTDVAGAVGALVVSDAALADVVTDARTRLSAFKVPTCWLVTTAADAVPLTATAKVDKAALQQLLQKEGTS